MRADAARNREQILEAARELVARAGPDLTMDELAARSGVAVGTLYRHFPTKTDLVDAVVAESVDRLAVLAEAALARVEAGASAWDELTAFWVSISDGPHAGRAARLAAATLRVSTTASTGSAPAVGAAGRRALDALQALLRTTQEAGDMRHDVTLADLFMLLAQAPERDEGRVRARYFEIVNAGLRPGRPAPPGRTRAPRPASG